MKFTDPVLPSIDTSSDHHVHTQLCKHAVGEMEEYVLAALNKGLRKITFLEHMEEGISAPSATWLSDEDFDRYFAEGHRLQDTYGDRLKIGLGVECGFNEEHVDLLLQRLSEREWDEIGISCHFLKIPQDDLHLNLFSRKEINVRRSLQSDCDKLLERYIRALTLAAAVLPGTMLCHLDGALRFVPSAQFEQVNPALVRGLLSTIKEKNMSLEVNTSGFAIRGEPFPRKEILTLAVQLGIPLVLSSDAHRPQDVGNYFTRFKPLSGPSA